MDIQQLWYRCCVGRLFVFYAWSQVAVLGHYAVGEADQARSEASCRAFGHGHISHLGTFQRHRNLNLDLSGAGCLGAARVRQILRCQRRTQWLRPATTGTLVVESRRYPSLVHRNPPSFRAERTRSLGVVNCRPRFLASCLHSGIHAARLNGVPKDCLPCSQLSRRRFGERCLSAQDTINNNGLSLLPLSIARADSLWNCRPWHYTAHRFAVQ